MIDPIYDPAKQHSYRFGGNGVARGAAIRGWRRFLKEHLLADRDYVSDLTGRRFSFLREEPQMHEGLITRAVVPSSVEWHPFIFHPINCFLLFESEHIPEPPSRALCYWLAVIRYGKEEVDAWVDSLPWKVPPDRAWAVVRGADVLKNELPWHLLTAEWKQRIGYALVEIERY